MRTSVLPSWSLHFGEDGRQISHNNKLRKEALNEGQITRDVSIKDKTINSPTSPEDDHSGPKVIRPKIYRKCKKMEDSASGSPSPKKAQETVLQKAVLCC